MKKSFSNSYIYFHSKFEPLFVSIYKVFNKTYHNVYIHSFTFFSEYTFITSLKICFVYTDRFTYYRKYILQITQPSQYICTQLQYRFAVISEAPSRFIEIESKEGSTHM